LHEERQDDAHPCSLSKVRARNKGALRQTSGSLQQSVSAKVYFKLVARGFAPEELKMPRGDKSKYTDKQKRQAEHIEEGYEARGVSKKEAEKRAWATVNKASGGGKKSGSGRGKPQNKAPAKKGGQKGGKKSGTKKK
jgi:hypothetical protein